MMCLNLHWKLSNETFIKREDKEREMSKEDWTSITKWGTTLESGIKNGSTKLTNINRTSLADFLRCTHRHTHTHTLKHIFLCKWVNEGERVKRVKGKHLSAGSFNCDILTTKPYDAVKQSRVIGLVACQFSLQNNVHKSALIATNLHYFVF